MVVAINPVRIYQDHTNVFVKQDTISHMTIVRAKVSPFSSLLFAELNMGRYTAIHAELLCMLFTIETFFFRISTFHISAGV